MTSVSDNDDAISKPALITNLTMQVLNTVLISIIIIGYNLFLYLGGLVIIFRLKTIARIIKELQKSSSDDDHELIREPDTFKRNILVHCHSMHVDVSL